MIHIIHILSVFVYGGFLITDKLFLSRMLKTLNEQEHKKAREAIMMHVRRVVPYALFTAVITGSYMVSQIFGPIVDGEMSRFQVLISAKAFFGLWLGLRGFNQKVFGINPWLFKGHLLPFILVIVIILLSQLMYL